MNMIEAPAEVKEEITKRLKDNGTIERLEENVLDALNTAAREIVSKSSETSSIEHKPMKGCDENSLKALESIFQFLKENGFDFTFKCLAEETGIEQTEKYGKLDIREIINAPPKEEKKEEESEKFVKVESESSDSNDNSSSNDDISIDNENSSDSEFIEIDDDDDDEKPAPKKEEKPKPVEHVNEFIEEPVRNVPPAEVISKSKFELNDYIVLARDL